MCLRNKEFKNIWKGSNHKNSPIQNLLKFFLKSRNHGTAVSSKNCPYGTSCNYINYISPKAFQQTQLSNLLRSVQVNTSVEFIRMLTILQKSMPEKSWNQHEIIKRTISICEKKINLWVAVGHSERNAISLCLCEIYFYLS